MKVFSARKVLLAALVLAIVAAGCGTAIPDPDNGTPFPETAWCYYFNFAADDYDAVVTQGVWQDGVGFYGNAVEGWYELNLAYTNAQVVQPAVIEVTIARHSGVTGDIDFGGDFNIFGLSSSFSQTLPDSIPSRALRLYPATSTASGSQATVNWRSSKLLDLVSLMVWGNGVNPFPTNSCEDISQTQEYLTGTPTFTITPTSSDTPTMTYTPTATPTGAAGFCLLQENWDDLHISGATIDANAAYGTGAGHTGNGLEVTESYYFYNFGDRNGKSLIYEIPFNPAWTFKGFQFYGYIGASMFMTSDGQEIDYKINGSGTWTQLTHGWDNAGAAPPNQTWTQALAVNGGSWYNITNVEAVRFYIHWTEVYPDDPDLIVDDVAVWYTDPSQYCSNPTPTHTNTPSPTPTETWFLSPTPTPQPSASRTPIIVASRTPTLTPGTPTNTSVPGATPTWFPTQTLVPFPTALPTHEGGEGNEDIFDRIGQIGDSIGSFFTWIVNAINGFFHWLGGLGDWLGGHLSNLLSLIENAWNSFWSIIQRLIDYLRELWAILQLLLAIARHLIDIFLLWLQQLIALVQTILAAWNSTFPTPIPGLPYCVTAPMDSDACAVFYILDNTIFSGFLGAAIMLVIIILIDLGTTFYFLRKVMQLLHRGEGVTKT